MTSSLEDEGGMEPKPSTQGRGRESYNIPNLCFDSTLGELRGPGLVLGSPHSPSSPLVLLGICFVPGICVKCQVIPLCIFYEGPVSILITLAATFSFLVMY